MLLPIEIEVFPKKIQVISKELAPIGDKQLSLGTGTLLSGLKISAELCRLLISMLAGPVPVSTDGVLMTNPIL